jgi:hypothetical protein
MTNSEPPFALPDFASLNHCRALIRPGAAMLPTPKIIGIHGGILE